MHYSTLVSKEVLADHLDDPDWVVFDCRFDLANTGKGREDYGKGHIPGARYAHLDEDLSSPKTEDSGRHPLPDPERFMAWLGRNGVSRTTQVVVYDDMAGSIASRLWWMLRHWLGHENVALLDGGWQCWENHQYPVSSEDEKVVPADYQATPNPAALITTRELASALDAGGWTLLDSRLPPRYKGEQEPLDPVAGHIPGAINQPFTDNLSNGHLQQPETLKQHYEYLLEGAPVDRTVCMCGSGVTACLSLLAMEEAGLPGARLYVGSWSEWVSDPSRPVARG